jgi:predicted regulator of Ras-like GTPase activity (Roadblock/LC7/MglB family)
MTPEETISVTDTLKNLLEETNRAGNFLISVVTDQNGLPIVSAAQDGFDPDRQSATVAMVKKTITQNEKRLGMSQAEEISIVDTDGQLLICRAFTANNYDLTLAILMANRQQPYRRITTHVISQINRVWSRRWK